MPEGEVVGKDQERPETELDTDIHSSTEESVNLRGSVSFNCTTYAPGAVSKLRGAWRGVLCRLSAHRPDACQASAHVCLPGSGEEA